MLRTSKGTKVSPSPAGQLPAASRSFLIKDLLQTIILVTSQDDELYDCMYEIMVGTIFAVWILNKCWKLIEE